MNAQAIEHKKKLVEVNKSMNDMLTLAKAVKTLIENTGLKTESEVMLKLLLSILGEVQ